MALKLGNIMLKHLIEVLSDPSDILGLLLSFVPIFIGPAVLRACDAICGREPFKKRDNIVRFVLSMVILLIACFICAVFFVVHKVLAYGRGGYQCLTEMNVIFMFAAALFVCGLADKALLNRIGGSREAVGHAVVSTCVNIMLSSLFIAFFLGFQVIMEMCFEKTVRPASAMSVFSIVAEPLIGFCVILPLKIIIEKKVRGEKKKTGPVLYVLLCLGLACAVTLAVMYVVIGSRNIISIN